MIKEKITNLISLLVSQLSQHFFFNRHSWRLTLGWSLLLFIALTWNWLQIRESVHQEAIISLRQTVEKDLSFRAWAASHGGVYVPVTKENRPNPYLHFLPKRDVITTDATKLTLLNPAYIMRQVNEKNSRYTTISSRLISLAPLNPVNAADHWERESLLALNENKDLIEISGITGLEQQLTIRLIQPFIVEESCLKCHMHQGYQVGDLIGAISANTPLTSYDGLIHSRQRALLPGYAMIWLAGFLGIGWFLKRIDISAQDLAEKERRQRAMVEAIPDMLFRYNNEGVFLNAFIKEEAAYNTLLSNTADDRQPKNIIGQKITDLLLPESAASLMDAIQKVISTGEMQIVEHESYLNQERVYFEERLVFEGQQEVVSIVRNVTDQKNMASRLAYLSYRDQLTGLHNRTFFEKELLRITKTDYQSVSIISIDVNGLKFINDTLGHLVGDQLLIAIGKILSTSLRSSDVLARIGGDEFVIILPNTNKKSTLEIMQRIKENVNKHNQKCPALPISIAMGAASNESLSSGLMATYKEADDAMYREKLKERNFVKDSIIQSLFLALKDTDLSTNHVQRLDTICTQMGDKMHLTPVELNHLALLCQAHDLGKVSILPKVLFKKEKLTSNEWNVIKEHPETGYRIALATPQFSQVADLILKHHEKWDGTGYPLGLQGTEIPMECRIFAIADAFVSMTSQRPYRDSLTTEEAMEEIKSQAGSHFDPQLVEIFLSLKHPRDLLI